MARKIMLVGRKAVGAKGSRRRRRAMLLSFMIAVGGSMLVMQTLQAVHKEGVFELDRNATNDGGPGQDWDDVFNNTDTADAAVFIADGEGPTIFTGGGSKDDLNTTNWLHKTGSTPDKDELLDGFAARYGNFLYFGADRTANNGDAQMGFWFFQQRVTPLPDGTFGPGQHQNGDILILSDFSGGGKNATVRVFQWHSPGGAINGTLDQIAGSLGTTADCVGPPAVPDNDPFCATVNNAVTPSPWPFNPKVGTSGSFAVGEFYEGGLDLTFLGLQNECFASFLVETRSSTSIDATLKDFVGGAFQPCESGLVTTPKDGAGNDIPPGGLSIGSGSITVTDSALINVTGAATWTGTVTFFLCGPTPLSGPFVPCTSGGTQIGTAKTANSPSPATVLSDPATITQVGRYCWRGEFTSGTSGVPNATDASAGECFQVNPVPSTLTTAQVITVVDHATVSSVGTIDGTIRFEAFSDATCSSAALLDITFAVSGGNTQTASSGPVTITTSPATLSWRVTFNSNNPNVLGDTSPCNTENTSITFRNDP